VGRVDISGNVAISLPDLQQHLRIRPGQPYSDAALESERTLIEDVYHREGFASAQASIRNESEPAVAAALALLRATCAGRIAKPPAEYLQAAELRGHLRCRADLRNGLTFARRTPRRPPWLPIATPCSGDLANLGFQSATDRQSRHSAATAEALTCCSRSARASGFPSIVPSLAINARGRRRSSASCSSGPASRWGSSRSTKVSAARRARVVSPGAHHRAGTRR
jgi:hypothetical protein